MTRQEAIELLKLDRDMANFNPITGEKMPMNEYNAKSVEALDMAIEALEQEPKRGKLIAIDDTHDQCMECGAIFCITSSDEWKVNYCPNCGARMEG